MLHTVFMVIHRTAWCRFLKAQSAVWLFSFYSGFLIINFYRIQSFGCFKKSFVSRGSVIEDAALHTAYCFVSTGSVIEDAVQHTAYLWPQSGTWKHTEGYGSSHCKTQCKFRQQAVTIQPLSLKHNSHFNFEFTRILHTSTSCSI